jgi:diguanylate cyclase (GGDEF)-like protein
MSASARSAAGWPTSASVPIAWEAEQPHVSYPVVPGKSAKSRYDLPMREFQGAVRPFAIPAAILAIAAVGHLVGPPMPDSLAGLFILGPYTLLAVAVAFAWVFNRGRAFVISASLLCAFAAQQIYPGKAVYTALVCLVPLNALLAMVRAERGVRYRAAYGWLLLLACEGVLIYGVSRLEVADLDNMLLRSPPTPLAGRILFAAAFAVAVWRAWPEHTPLQVGNAGALVAFYIAAEWVGAPRVYSTFMAAAGAILIIALVQESHRLAFRDTLTGLPGRRALDERLRTLKRKYAIAMVDVDHFKKFNDTHGHDIGDQVLKLVGARLAEVGGGGTAFRYGGEEFCVLFPDAELEDVLLQLEAIRVSIEGYRMAVRAPDRPKKVEQGTKRRGEGVPDKHLSVTVSIGACSSSAKVRTPAQVIKAADEALYRAKQGGRNRVST